MIRKFLGIAACVAFASGLASCASSNRSDVVDTVSVKYDPYDYSIEDLRNTADASCKAKNADSFAIKADEIENTSAVKWSYMSFYCVV